MTQGQSAHSQAGEAARPKAGGGTDGGTANLDPEAGSPAKTPTSNLSDRTGLPVSQSKRQARKAKSHAERERIQAAYRKWEKYTVWPMFFLSLLFVGLTAIVISPPPNLNRSDWQRITAATLFLWAIFVADFLVRFVFSPDRKHFLKTQSFEMSTLLVPYLRPFLLIRYVWRLDYFRHRGASGLRQRAIIAVAMFAVFFVYTSSTLVWVVERNAPGANILHWSDAIWWGFVTISTVGYGDYYPVTGTGRFVAVGLMVGGLFTVGVTSAAIISAFNNSMRSYLKEYGATPSASSVQRGHAIMEAISMGALQEDKGGSAHPSSATAREEEPVHSEEK